jgi:hypothetical protein
VASSKTVTPRRVVNAGWNKGLDEGWMKVGW